MILECEAYVFDGARQVGALLGNVRSVANLIHQPEAQVTGSKLCFDYTLQVKEIIDELPSPAAEYLNLKSSTKTSTDIHRVISAITEQSGRTMVCGFVPCAHDPSV